AYDAPEQSDYQSDAGAVDQVAVVGGEQPFADAGAAGGGAYHQTYPHHELAGENNQLIGMRGKAKEKSVDNKVA
ncbi:hypothetical protein, partial [Bacillus pumilus]|uniref:hypothetical protein n=1 Tax=Bacillus pumilus TaxID=1408 RepID=UPI0021B63D5A